MAVVAALCLSILVMAHAPATAASDLHATILYDTWRWTGTARRPPRDRILTLRPDHTYDLVEQDSTLEYPFCAGSFTLDSTRSEGTYHLTFKNWWRRLERSQAVRFPHADTLTMSAHGTASAPVYRFVRDPALGARRREGAKPPAPPPSSSPASSAELPAQGQFVYYDEEPVPLSKPDPVYPEAARSARVEGKVVLHVLVGKDGLVKNVKISRGVTGLNEAAMDCARLWSFKPARNAGNPVAVWVEVPMEFRL